MYPTDGGVHELLELLEFETGAPSLTTAFDDNVSFFLLSRAI